MEQHCMRPWCDFTNHSTSVYLWLIRFIAGSLSPAGWCSFPALHMDLTWPAKSRWPLPSWQHYFAWEYRLLVKVRHGRTTAGHVRRQLLERPIILISVRLRCQKSNVNFNHLSDFAWWWFTFVLSVELVFWILILMTWMKLYELKACWHCEVCCHQRQWRTLMWVLYRKLI